MPAPQDTSESVDAKAFQLVLHKLESLERAMQALPPLLGKIIAHLEAQQPAAAEVEVATYAQLYPDIEPDATEVLPDVRAADALPHPPPPRRWWRWFLKQERN